MFEASSLGPQRPPDRSAGVVERLEHEIPITVTAIYSLTPLATTGPLTDAQRDALLTALDCGYYDSPRPATMSDVADALGISQQALSSRLRRGTRNLIENGELGTEE